MAVIERLRNSRIRPTRSENSTGLKVVRMRELEGAAMYRSDKLGMLFRDPPAQPDDLKQIYGIADVLENKLNYYGVYTFEQIMNWDADIVEEFSSLLSFKDRIQRDAWVEQAGRLYREAQSDRKAA